jgi:hypothetical protein
MDRILISSLFLVFALSANAQSNSISPAKKFGIKSGKIIYKFENGPQSGEKIIIFDDWGISIKEIVTTLTDTAMMRQLLFDAPPAVLQMQLQREQHNMILFTPKDKYDINLDQKTGHGRFSLNLGDFGQLPGFHKKLAGKDTILGRVCDVETIRNAFKLWKWNGIVLKKKIMQDIHGGKVEEFAVEIDEDYKIKPDEFDIPKDIRIN